MIDEWVNGAVPVRYYMEANFMQDLLLDEFKKEGESRGYHIAITGDKRKKNDKFARIEGISPLFERGSKVHDDGPDALEGAIFLLNKRNPNTPLTYRLGGSGTNGRNSYKY